MSDNRRVDLRKVILVLMIVTCVLPREQTIYAFQENLTREYGSVISITIPMIAMLGIIFLNRGQISYNRFIENPLLTWFNFAIASGLFILINEGKFSYYLVAASRMMLYILMYILLSYNISKKTFFEAIDLGFRITLIIQTIIGCLYEFFGISIPIISNYSDSVRNGMKRMVGSFSHPGDFSLYIAIITLYFVTQLIFRREKRVIPFVFMGTMDILLSGARSMLICTLIACFALLLRKNRNNIFLKLGLVISVIVGIVIFLKSDIFQDLFIKHNFFDMFLARFVHWIIGIKIMTRNPINFICGVGLNNCVDYINEHFSAFTGLLAQQTVIDNSFVSHSPIHNSYLIAGVETGIIGIILYARIYLKGLIDSIHLVKKKSKYKAEAMFIGAAFFTYAVYAMQGWSLQKNYALTMLVVLCAFLHHLKVKEVVK